MPLPQRQLCDSFHEYPSCYGGFSWYCSAVIERSAIRFQLDAALARSRVVVLVGPRQCGKTTLARQLLSEELATPATLFGAS